jgi:hypothetical protein
MYEIRLNNVNIHIKGQNVFIFDVFGDMSSSEIEIILSYIAEEGFIDSEKEINVFVKSKSFLSLPKKADKKKN